MVIIEYLKYDFLITLPLFLWVLFVMKIVSRWVFDFAIRKGYPPNSATYFGRKTIHILASGVAALLIPILYKEPLIPFLSAIVLAIYTYLPHKKNQLNQWYQAKDNTKEVNFSIMWGISILVGWYFDRTFWLGVIPVLFMSFGDGITGIIRNIKYKKRNKSWEGSLGMLIVCTIIGLRIGIAGIVAAIFATIIEKLDFMDDNISVPVASLSILIIFSYFFPHLT
jgi:dolichol kinase